MRMLLYSDSHATCVCMIASDLILPIRFVFVGSGSFVKMEVLRSNPISEKAAAKLLKKFVASKQERQRRCHGA